MSSRSGASKKRQRNSKGSANPTDAASNAADDPNNTSITDEHNTSTDAASVNMDDGTASVGATGSPAAPSSAPSASPSSSTSGAPPALSTNNTTTAAGNGTSPVAQRSAKQRKTQATQDVAHGIDDGSIKVDSSAVTPAGSSSSPAVSASSPEQRDAAAGTANNNSVAPSPSPIPSGASTPAAATSSTAFPSLPAGVNKPGYVAAFYWNTHYSSPKPVDSVPYYTEIVPSIPNIFFQIVQVVANVEWQTKGKDILPEVDRKFVKPLTAKEVEGLSAVDRKQVIHSPAGGQDYLVHVARKEYIRLIYAPAEEGGLLARLNLCPLLIDVFQVSPGNKKSLMGGAGGYRYLGANVEGPQRSGTVVPEVIPEKGSDYRCVCDHVVKDEDAVNHAALGNVADEIAGSDSASGAATDSAVKQEKAGDDSMQDIPTTSPQLQPLAVSTSTTTTGGILSPAATKESVVRKIIPGSGSDRDKAGFRSPPASGSGSHMHSSGALGGDSTSSCVNCSNWQKKYAKQAKTIELLKAELEAVHNERGLWEQKWLDEKDFNIRLWEKTLLIQKQLRDMSRPLGVSLTHAMNHISATNAPPVHGAPPALAAPGQPQVIAQPMPAGAIPHQQMIVHPTTGQVQVMPPHLVSMYNGVDGVGLPTAVVHPLPTGLIAVDPHHAHTTATVSLTDQQLQQHLLPAELQHPNNIQNQLAQARIQQQQQQQLQQQQQVVVMQQ